MDDKISRIVGYKITKDPCGSPEGRLQQLADQWNSFDWEPADKKTLTRMDHIRTEMQAIIAAHPHLNNTIALKTYSYMPVNVEKECEHVFRDNQTIGKPIQNCIYCGKTRVNKIC